MIYRINEPYTDTINLENALNSNDRYMYYRICHDDTIYNITTGRMYSVNHINPLKLVEITINNEEKKGDNTMQFKDGQSIVRIRKSNILTCNDLNKYLRSSSLSNRLTLGSIILNIATNIYYYITGMDPITTIIYIDPNKDIKGEEAEPDQKEDDKFKNKGPLPERGPLEWNQIKTKK